MIGAMLGNGVFNPVTGRVQVTLNNSIINGYLNRVEQYGTYGVMSVPLPNQLVSQVPQSATQVYINGYNNTILDANYSINAGEVSLYSTAWYSFTANGGIYMQPVGTANKENAMMGQSTNAVLSDMLSIIIEIIDYLGTHTHLPGMYNVSAVPVVGASGAPIELTPDDTDIVADQTYINGNKNLAITGTYVPK